MMLPLDASGFAPSSIMKSVRSTSGTGNRSCCPNMKYEASMSGSWSQEVAEKRFFEPKVRRNGGPKTSEPKL